LSKIRKLADHEQKSSFCRKEHTLQILAFFWHPKITSSTDISALPGAYRRFIELLRYLENYEIEIDVIENHPLISSSFGQHEVYQYETPFSEETYVTKFLTRLLATLMAAVVGLKACRKKRYDLLIAPVGELFCTTIPVYITHLVTRIPWTAVAQNVPEAYAVVDSSGRLIVSITRIYEYYRRLRFGVFDAFLIACYSFFPKLLLPKIYNRAKAILSVGRSLSLYLRSLGIRCKMFVVCNGLNVDEIAKSKTCAKRYAGIYLGRFVPEKGIFDALEVWSKVAEIFPEASLLVAGYSDEAQMSAVRRTINEFNMSKNVKVLGEVSEEDKCRLLKSSSLFLYLSRFESFGLVIGEAMACGLPVVAYDVPFVRELFSCPAVLKAPISDIDGAVASVCDLLSDEEKRQRLGSEAAEYVKRYEWSEVAKKEAQIYRIVLSLDK